MKRGIITLFLSLLIVATNAQNVTITGRSNKTNALMRIFAYEDLVNEAGVLLDQRQSDAKGHFILEGKVDETLPARIYVGLDYVDLILTPNASYEIEIIVPEQKENVSFFEKELPTIRVKRATDKGIYRQIIYSEAIINSYMTEHFNQIYRGRQVRYIDSIQNAISRDVPDIKNDYVKGHNRYKIAAIKLGISSDGGKRIIKEYYDGQPVLYTQSAYIDLFKELFEGYFNSASYDSHLVNEAFMEGPAALKKYLDTDPLMANNPRLGELITIYNLQKLCHGDRNTSRLAKEHLSHIKAQTQYAEHKTIISNIFVKLERLAPGTDAPAFTLKDSDGKDVSLSDYKEGLVLLQFVDGMSPVSEHQFSELRSLHRQWHDSVQILTIATHDKMDFYKQQFTEKKQDWPLLDLGDNILLLEAYNARTFPEYILIRKGNKIGEAPAPSPERYLEERVRRLYGK
ncbi:MAG: redoxin domain-containing protein [Bacteroidales bacterium]|nr:redoxin domain-containing protein [Bacteroidales bacterium]